MSKKLIIILTILFLVLFIPIPLHLKDGGTVEYKAIVYQVSKVHKLNSNSQSGYDTGLIIKIFGFKVFDNVKESKNMNNNNNNNINANTTENQKNDETQKDKVQENPNDNETTNDKKIAIIYFSATGTTRKVAGYIKNATGGDLIEIEPKEKYTDSDLNYGNDNSRANKEQNDSKARPEILNNINTDSYDVIYLGYPIWWGDVPKIILTFLDNHNLKDKTIIPFCTSGSTGISDSLSTLKNYNKNVNWIDGKRFSSSATQDEVTNWVKELSY